jgi:hypothetical protein
MAGAPSKLAGINEAEFLARMRDRKTNVKAYAASLGVSRYTLYRHFRQLTEPQGLEKNYPPTVSSAGGASHQTREQDTQI